MFSKQNTEIKDLISAFCAAHPARLEELSVIDRLWRSDADMTARSTVPAHVTASAAQLQDRLPIDIDVHGIPESRKKNEPAHIHIDLRYLFASPSGALLANPDEVSALSWVSPDALPPAMRRGLDCLSHSNGTGLGCHYTAASTSNIRKLLGRIDNHMDIFVP